LVAGAGRAQAQFTAAVTAGELEFDLGAQAPFPNMGPALLRPSNLVSALESDRSQLNQFLWFYHIAGEARAYNFNTEGGQEVQTSGATITVTQHYQGWDGIQTYELVATGPDVGYLRSRAIVRNLGSAPLSISLFHYADLDDNGTFTDDLAAMTTPGVVTVTDSTGPFSLRFAADVPPDAWEASAWRTLLNSLANNGQVNLGNSGLPFGPGDVTMAWQWNLVVMPGQEASVGDTITIVNGTGPACYVNCDGSTGAGFLNVNDFVCFSQRFAAGEPYADCNHDQVLNVNDFVCFQQAFAAGCSAP
jgi:hypothetical protein